MLNTTTISWGNQESKIESTSLETIISSFDTTEVSIRGAISMIAKTSH